MRANDSREKDEQRYQLARDYWRRGFATEAAFAVREYAFDSLRLTRLIAIIDPKNVASIGVAENVGLKYERTTLFRTVPVDVYGIERPAGGS